MRSRQMRIFAFAILSLLLFPTVVYANDVVLDHRARPISGTKSIRALLSNISSSVNDHLSFSIRSGGRQDIYEFFGKKEDSCVGFANTAPTAKVKVSPAQDIHFFVISSGDTTLVVRSPRNKWYCNDDSSDNSLNPLISLRKAPAGEYSIWVGSYEKAERHEAFLFVSDKRYSPSKPPASISAEEQVASATGMGGQNGKLNTTARVTTRNLNVRAGPGTNYSILTTIAQGTVVDVIGQKSSCQWLSIVYSPRSGESQSGWISGSSRYVSLSTQCSSIPSEVSTASTSSPLYVQNVCFAPIEVAIRYKQASGNWLTDGWWTFDPNEGSYIDNSSGRRVESSNNIFYFYAQSIGEADIVWEGNERRQFDDRTLPMRTIELSRDSQNKYILKLHCDDVPAPTPLSTPRPSGSNTRQRAVQQGCWLLQNQSSAEATWTITRKGGGFERVITLKKNVEQSLCLAVGEYTYSISTYQWSKNGELKVEGGEDRYWWVRDVFD